VDVAVFPPISVANWTVGTLADRIAEVRQLYLDTLADWPVDELPEVDLYGLAEKAGKKPVPQRARAKSGKTAAKKTAKKAAAKGPRTRGPKGRP
ncbi:MAG: HAD-IB family hydrolase, partial [Mycobacterium sp.]